MILKCIQRKCSLRTLNYNLFLSSKSSLSTVFLQTPKKKKPLSAFFKESVGISEKTDDNGDIENSLVTEKLRILSEQVRSLNNNKNQEKPVPKSVSKLLNLFTEKTEHVKDFGSTVVKKELTPEKKCDLGSIVVKKELTPEKKCDLGSIVVKKESNLIYKELSPEMQVFVRFLDEEGYFKDANFVRDGKLDLSAFRESYARNYLVSVAVKFGKDHQEIAKWLSASDLKKVANFGCPSLGSKTVSAAKNMREFFKTEEVKVCQSFVLKESCELANKRHGHSVPKLQLNQVMRVIVMYAMESVPVSEEIRSSVSILLKEVMGLSKTVVKKELTPENKCDLGSIVVKKELTPEKKCDLGSIAVKKELTPEKKCDLGSIVVKKESNLIYKGLSPEMQVFVRFLDEEGYFKDANFVRDGKLDLSAFRESYARNYLVSVAVKFGKDHQEIAKWLSASDLKKVANFGCPSLGSKTVSAAKNMREFFKTEEVKVCQSCVLKESCELANKRHGYSVPKLQLNQVMRVIVMYAMESVPQQLVVPVSEEIRSSVSILLKEVMCLSKTVS